MHVIFLPATEPDDETFGRPERDWEAVRQRFPDVHCAAVTFDRLVWYTREIRQQAFARIAEMTGGGLSDVVLVGFSKSGCGAINMALDAPDAFGAVVVFDAPLVNEDVTRFDGLADFYPDAESLREDVPLLRVRRGETWGSTRVILVHGDSFADEMAAFETELASAGLAAEIISDTAYSHHWNAGWIVRALACVAGPMAPPGQSCG